MNLLEVPDAAPRLRPTDRRQRILSNPRRPNCPPPRTQLQQDATMQGSLSHPDAKGKAIRRTVKPYWEESSSSSSSLVTIDPGTAHSGDGILQR
jgi:hypothetical protein